MRPSAVSLAGARAVRGRGFTVIEVMVVLALLAIVAGLAVPSFRSFIGTMNTKSAAFDLINDLTLARSEAIKRNLRTRVQPVSSDWAKGWQVTVVFADDTEETLRERAALGYSTSVSAPTAGVQFQPNGRLSADEATANLRWSVTSTISGVTARCVVITPTGSARSQNSACS